MERQVVSGPLWGRRGHARVVVLTILPEELTAAIKEFGTSDRVEDSNSWVAPGAHKSEIGLSTPVLVAAATDRTKAAAQEATRELLEDWRPEVLVVSGIAAGLRRAKGPKGQRYLEGPVVGDVVVGTYVHDAEYMKVDGGRLLARYLVAAQPSSRLVSKHCRPVDRIGTWMTPELQASRCDGSTAKVHFEEIVAVSAVMGDPGNEHHQAIVTHYDKAAAADMESHGVSYAIESYDGGCHYRPRWLCVRSVSDEVALGPEASGLLRANPHEVRDDWREPASRTAAAFAHAVIKDLLAKPRAAVPGYAGASAYTAPMPPYLPQPYQPQSAPTSILPTGDPSADLADGDGAPNLSDPKGMLPS
jgi:nucleoside phosphorylase